LSTRKHDCHLALNEMSRKFQRSRLNIFLFSRP
jgi:hypothetical protein